MAGSTPTKVPTQTSAPIAASNISTAEKDMSKSLQLDELEMSPSLKGAKRVHTDSENEASSQDTADQVIEAPAPGKGRKKRKSGAMLEQDPVAPQKLDKSMISARVLAEQYKTADASESRSPSPMHQSGDGTDVENDHVVGAITSFDGHIDDNPNVSDDVNEDTIQSRETDESVGNESIEKSYLAVQTPAPKKPTKPTKKSTVPDAKVEPAAKRHKSSVVGWPKGYVVSENDRWVCPVVGCDHDASRKDTMGRHINAKHKGLGKSLVDNGDGTLRAVIDSVDDSSSDEDEDGIPNKIVQPTKKVDNSKKHESPVPPPSAAAKASVSSKPRTAPPSVGETTARTTSSQSHKRSKTATTAPIEDAVTKIIGPKWHAVNDLGKKVLEQAGTSNTPEKAVRGSTGKKAAPKKTVANQDDSDIDGVAPPASSRPLAAAVTRNLESWELNAQKFVINKETVAYSGPYMTSKPLGVQILGATFKVHHLLPGEAVTMTANSNLVRQCPVSQGQIGVKLGDLEFSISQNGIFIIRPGITCTITNRGYEAASFLTMASVVDGRTLKLCD